MCNIELVTPTAPVLVLDLLAGRGMPMSAEQICQSGELMGIAEGTMRVGITRLRKAGSIVRVERGRYKIVGSAHPLHRLTKYWWRKQAMAIPWMPGSWIAIFDGCVPRADRRNYRHHSLALTLLGFAELQPGLHIRPDNFSGGVRRLVRQLRRLGLADDAVAFQLSRLERRTEISARRLWPVETLVKTDQKYLAALERSLSRLAELPLADAARESLLLGRLVIAHLVRDPVLPQELMPTAIRRSLLPKAVEYQSKARKLWTRWLDDPGRSSG